MNLLLGKLILQNAQKFLSKKNKHTPDYINKFVSGVLKLYTGHKDKAEDIFKRILEESNSNDITLYQTNSALTKLFTELGLENRLTKTKKLGIKKAFSYDEDMILDIVKIMLQSLTEEPETTTKTSKKSESKTTKATISQKEIENMSKKELDQNIKDKLEEITEKLATIEAIQDDIEALANEDNFVTFKKNLKDTAIDIETLFSEIYRATRSLRPYLKVAFASNPKAAYPLRIRGIDAFDFFAKTKKKIICTDEDTKKIGADYINIDRHNYQERNIQNDFIMVILDMVHSNLLGSIKEIILDKIEQYVYTKEEYSLLQKETYKQEKIDAKNIAYHANPSKKYLNEYGANLSFTNKQKLIKLITNLFKEISVSKRAKTDQMFQDQQQLFNNTIVETTSNKRSVVISIIAALLAFLLIKIIPPTNSGGSNNKQTNPKKQEEIKKTVKVNIKQEKRRKKRKQKKEEEKEEKKEEKKEDNKNKDNGNGKGNGKGKGKGKGKDDLKFYKMDY